MTAKGSIGLLWKVLGPQRRFQFIGLLLLSLVSAIAEVANLGALFPVLNLLATPQKSIESLWWIRFPLSHLSQQQLLLGLGACFLFVVVCSTILRVLTTQIQLKLSSLMAADLADQVFCTVLSKPFSWHLAHKSSLVLGYLTKDVDQVFISIQAMLVIVVNLSIVLMLATSLLFLAPIVMLLVAPLLIFFYVVVYRFTRATLQVDGQNLTLSYEASLQIAQEALGGIRDIILDKSHSYFSNAYGLRNRKYRLALASINSKAQIPRYLIEGFVVVLIITISLVYAIGGQSIDKQLPMLGILSLGAYRLLQPLQQCFGSFSLLKANQASLHRVSPYLSSGNHVCNSIPLSYASIELSRSFNTPTIEFTDVSFKYSADSPLVLRHMSLSIKQFETVALVGPSGSGKSTCTDLILGLLMPTSGHIHVYGNPLHKDPQFLAEWQSRIAHVPQNIYLADSSFTSNIAFGVPTDQIDHELVRQVSEEARIATLIDSSPQGYNTVVGERGVKLSGGQRQRIGIARALYKQADFLVLDEATSSLDNLTEHDLMSTINSLSMRTTVLIVAHRLSTVKNCNRIMLLDSGSIHSSGTYSYLYQHCPKFKKLARVIDS